MTDIVIVGAGAAGAAAALEIDAAGATFIGIDRLAAFGGTAERPRPGPRSWVARCWVARSWSGAAGPHVPRALDA